MSTSSEDKESLIKLESPCTAIICGPTSCGKTSLLYDILKHAKGIFSSKPKQIFYCYGIYQSLYDDMKTNIPNIHFFSGVPTREDLESWGADSSHKILILDDVLQRAAKNIDVADLFCQYSHHLNFSSFLLTQNIFANGKQFRTISLNTHYFIMFKSQRDQLQIQTLGRQMFPSMTRYFNDAFSKATEKQYGYLLIDAHPRGSIYKLRTNILPGQLMCVFLPDNSTA